MTGVVYQPWMSNFGDQWATINLLARRASTTKSRVRLHSPPSLRPMHHEIFSALLIPDAPLLELTWDDPTETLSGFDVWACPFFPTWVQWDQRQAHTQVCYQFDGRSSADAKNPTPREHDLLVRALQQSGFEAVRLGDHLSVAKCVDIAANSAFFVGVTSGMACLCHSVGVPMFLLEYQLPVVTTHRGKSYIHCQGTEDFLRHKMPTWIDYLRFIGHPDGARSTVPAPRSERDRRAEAGDRWWLP